MDDVSDYDIWMYELIELAYQDDPHGAVWMDFSKAKWVDDYENELTPTVALECYYEGL